MRLKVLAIVALLAVAGGAIFFSFGGGLAPAATAGTTLLTAAASVADVTDDIAATGTIEATTQYAVSFGAATGSTNVTCRRVASSCTVISRLRPDTIPRVTVSV